MYIIVRLRRVAQLGRALRSGRRGRRFESCHADGKAAEEMVAHPPGESVVWPPGGIKRFKEALKQYFRAFLLYNQGG